MTIYCIIFQKYSSTGVWRLQGQSKVLWKLIKILGFSDDKSNAKTQLNCFFLITMSTIEYFWESPENFIWKSFSVILTSPNKNSSNNNNNVNLVHVLEE